VSGGTRPFTAGELHDLAVRALTALDVPAADAAIVAACLVDAELEGRAGHGLVRLPFLLRRLRAGLIDPRPRLEVTRLRPATALLDAGNGLGPVAGVRAVDLAAELAGTYGAGVVAVRRGNHLGALGFYLRRFVERGLVGLCFSNTPPAVAPPGAASPFLGTNPIAAGFPAPDGPVLVDMATSQVARGGILLARQAGRPIPEGWAVDAEGRPTTDPDAALGGSLAPLGGHKGFALALMVELLTGVLAGAGVGPGVTGTVEPSDRPSDVGHSFWSLDPEAFGGGFAGRAAGLAAELRALGGRVPGELGAGERRRRLREGVQVPVSLVAELDALTPG
jgi:(2R)-3-sulfolactate dehydrogenase (NADP+)